MAAGATADISDELRVGDDQRGELTISDGATVSNGFARIGAADGSTGRVTVDGSDATWTNIGDLTVGNTGFGTLSIRDGGTVVNATGYVGRNRTSNGGRVTVDGVDSTWMNTGNLYIGGSAGRPGGDGMLDVRNSGLVDVDGTLRIWSSSTVTLDGGDIVTNTLDITAGGALNFLAGSLTINAGFELGGNAFPLSHLGPHQTLRTPATTTIAANRTLTLEGGKLETRDLLVNGALQFHSGTLELTGGGISGLSRIDVPTAGEFRATGVYVLPISGAPGSSITATGDLTLGDASRTDGFGTAGALHAGDQSVTLLDANDVVFDSLAAISLGNGGNPGTLHAAGGLTLDFGGNITGQGTVDTPNDVATPLVNNGHITGNSEDEHIELTGYVKGVGTLDNVEITGTDAPGFSPATVIRGSVTYNGALEIEIGGKATGGFDQIHHILGAGIASLDGTLDVLLTNGFMPEAHETFEIITASGGVNGIFATMSDELPPLDDRLQWEILYGANNVVLNVVSVGLPGDYNLNGVVDAADYTVWRDNVGGPAGRLPNDVDGGVIGQSQYDTWKANFGNTSPLGSSVGNAPVPEPSSVLLLTLAPAAACLSRRLNERLER